MPTDGADGRTGCWYQGTSCAGHGGLEGQQFKVTGTTVAAEFAHPGCSPGNYTLVYEPSSSPLKVRVCAKRSPAQKCNTVIRDGASWDVAPLLKANHATDVTIVKP
jgi:hypothetical protein